MTPPIDFLQVDQLPWADGVAALASGQAPRAKLLRSGPSGELTAVVDLTPGQRWAGRPGTTVSFLVLGGQVEVDGRVHGHLGFGQVCPEGSTTWVAAANARLLVFQAPTGGNGSGLVPAVDTLDAEWGVTEDPEAGIWRQLTLTPAGNPAAAVALRSLAVGDAALATHRHDWDEEVFVIDGERLTPVGAMTAGTYAWRPRGLWHGGYRTGSPGALLLVRRLGDPAALAGAPEPGRHRAAAEPVRRDTRLLPAAASTADLLRRRATLTGRRE